VYLQTLKQKEMRLLAEFILNYENTAAGNMASTSRLVFLLFVTITLVTICLICKVISY